MQFETTMGPILGLVSMVLSGSRLDGKEALLSSLLLRNEYNVIICKEIVVFCSVSCVHCLTDTCVAHRSVRALRKR